MTSKQQLIEQIALSMSNYDLDEDDVRRINAAEGFTYDVGDGRQWTRHEGASLSPADLDKAIANAR